MSSDGVFFYSTLLALLALTALALAVGLLAYRLIRGPSAGDLLGDKALWLAWLVAFVATAGSLIYSEVIHFVPCRLCWFQRIAMYPMAVILLIGAIRREVQIKFYALPLALAGLATSVYHYVVQRVPGVGGSSCNPDSPCSAIFVEMFDFVTIPFMAGCGFILIAVLLGFYVKQTSSE